MIQKKKPSKLSTVKQICYRDIEFTLQGIKLFQDYIDEYNVQYHNDEYSYVKFATMVIDAYTINLASLSDILFKIDPNFKKKITKFGNF